MGKIERTKNATRNIMFGGILKIYQIIMPFIMRTAMLYLLGVQYLGLNSLFVSILQVLNLAELGVGSAMVYSIYKPIVDDDTKQICALMKLYKLYYRIIGLVIAIFGVILLPFIPRLISGGVPSDINVYVLYLLNLGATVLTYWLFAYKNCLLNAYQRDDITSKITLIMASIQYLFQILTLVLRNYYLYLIVSLFIQALTNIVTAIIVSKMYPNYNPTGELEKNEIKKINRRVRDLFTSKIGGVILNSSDTIVISAFLGLTMLAVYQNYFYILNSIIMFVSIIFNSCVAGIGNSIIVETKEKNFNDLKKFTFIIAWIAGFCTCCLLCLYQPFIKIWVGEQYELDFTAVICLCIYYFVYEINKLLNMYKDAAGIWHEDRFRPLIAALVNLGLNLILVNIIGIYGVMISTVLATILVEIPWLLYNLFTILFEKSYLRGYLKNICLYTIVCFIGCLITYLICDLVNLSDWIEIIVKGLICCVVPNIIFYGAYRKTSEFMQSIELADKITRGKLSLKSRLLNINGN
ncbi:polysaccharide biosynthesis protein [Clostridium sp. SM-530-WT-3G]|nr:oligosaccharide flippase family protein [Clostridium sp. SM-530-WT-3G]NME82445.1 polysaccharide biosynthesis protein [Clostridium sp. SM-530-WT-3G]